MRKLQRRLREHRGGPSPALSGPGGLPEGRDALTDLKSEEGPAWEWAGEGNREGAAPGQCSGGYLAALGTCRCLWLHRGGSAEERKGWLQRRTTARSWHTLLVMWKSLLLEGSGEPLKEIIQDSSWPALVSSRERERERNMERNISMRIWVARQQCMEVSLATSSHPLGITIFSTLYTEQCGLSMLSQLPFLHFLEKLNIFPFA